MVGEMVQNSQSLYSFTFNAIFIIHKDIYSHLTTTFLFKKYIYSHLTTYILFTKIFTHILRDVFIHIHQLIFIHIHHRNIGSTRCNIYSTFSVHPLRASFRSHLPLFSECKMTDKGRPSPGEMDLLHWRDLFSAALDLLEECEREWDTGEVGVRENIQIKLEYLILALQKALPFVSINSAVLNEILGNILLLHRQWLRHDRNWTNLALYCVTSPEVSRSGSVGRPRYVISEEVLLHLRSSGFMEERRGPNRGSYLVGTSMQNQQIERLERCLSCCFTYILLHISIHGRGWYLREK